MAKLLIKNGRVWDGSQFFSVDVLTEGKRIAKMEANCSDEADFMFDASGKIVSAGLVDAHVHLRGVSIDEFGTPGEVGCFPFGVTAVADAGSAHGDKALLDSFMLKAVALTGIEVKADVASFDFTERMLERYGDRAVGIKVYFDTTQTEVTSTAVLKQACDYAHAKGLRVMVHCANSPVPMAEMLDVLSAGDILTHSFHGGRYTAAEDGFESMKRAQARGVVIDVGFAGHVHTDFDVLRQAIACGMIPDLISTDLTKCSSYIRGGRYGMTMCMSIAKHLGMSEEDILRAVTKNPAKALGKEQDWGALKVGGVADLAVLDVTDEGFSLTDRAGNHIESDKGYRCLLTVADGQVVYRY